MKAPPNPATIQPWVLAGQNTLQPAPATSCSRQKALQKAKIKEIARAVQEAGLSKLDDQSIALGLGRSTGWAMLRGNYKAPGISAKTINRMLTSPHLPRAVRVALLEYIEEKAAGHYGHGKAQCRKFRQNIRDYDSEL